MKTLNKSQSILVVQAVRTSLFHFTKNPFRKDSKIEKITHASEFFNYKPSPVDEHGSEKFETAYLVQNFSDQSIHRKSIYEMDEMDKEIQLNNAISSLDPQEIKLIGKIKRATIEEINEITIAMQPPKVKNTLILDLDETLIHTLRTHTQDSYIRSLQIFNTKYMASSNEQSIQFVKRPFLDKLLSTSAANYEIIVYA